MNYHDWDYNHSSHWISDDMKKNIVSLYDSGNKHDITQFLYWIHQNHPDYALSFKDFIIPKLLEKEHFDIADQLFNDKIFVFDKKIAEQSAFYLSLDFNDNFFNYWNTKVLTLSHHEQHSCYKKFWTEFLSYQFLKSEIVIDNLPILSYVFDKVPFYLESDYDIVNGYFIKERESFFKNRIPNLSNNVRSVLLQQFAILCAIHYPDFKSMFIEEFQKFPELLEVFDKTQLYSHLDDKFTSKPTTKKSKI